MTAPALSALAAARALHDPVMLQEVLTVMEPALAGVILDGTFGAGGYASALLDAGAARVIALDRDPEAVARGREWAPAYEGRLEIVEGRFGDLDRLIEEPLAGVVLDIGVSSMQIDEARRGFSFQKDGPLDMRMGGAGPSAADLVNDAPEAELADIFFLYGEERGARRLARAIARARADAPITGTLALATLIERNAPRPKPGRPHAATRVFQALRIAVNDELGELARGLSAAEARLAPGGVLAVVTFHSLEDRIVKRFLRIRGGAAPGVSRHAPEAKAHPPGFEIITRKALEPSAEEIARNPRARSARLRAARRTGAPAARVESAALGLPRIRAAGGDG
ncbi:16S rRNA (cytosine(1402)-N(4))-methyltransferase RsmH [Pikeienuella piscinae]|uniref:Ribosomal RNA small subunit methyltransferase H n=1 Tax=Pikeienuella piscinae TaxID=2748098 RepID=A0A7M3T6L4_9RHOB|nr:16S rRNA (cytosine(1402)-N(4))-methyltransferase RsmH [Pikeienuella piscinae]QIE57645.1 16S rRNA (cytosine(1402)-N(4))-methyltransferase RsmH [Pikeienuella piscinae]